MTDKFKLVIRKSEGIEYEGDVYAVSSTNTIGNFDVLFNHSNFVAEIKDLITIRTEPNTKKDMIITTGILSAKENIVEIFLGI